MKLLSTFEIFILIGCAILVPKVNADPVSLKPTKTPVYGVKVVNVYPHDAQAFTQGLIYYDGFLYESTGLRGQSSLRKVLLETGKVVRKSRLHPRLFGEGLAVWQGQLVQLTWHAGKAFVYDIEKFEMLRAFTYAGEGWGLTTDDDGFIQSDGSAHLRFLDPKTFREIKRVKVTDEGKPISNLNELEFIRGEVFANVWFDNRIAKIDPKSGKVVAWIDLSDLVPPEHRGSEYAVLNGIAYDAEGDRLFVTGKMWSKLYEIKIDKRK